MKQYGKVDVSWADSRFRAMIEEAIQMTKKHERTFVVRQDLDGNVMVCESDEFEDVHSVFACWAGVDENKEPSERAIILTDHVRWERYTLEQMVPRVRDVLTKGMVELGPLGFLSEGRLQLRYAEVLARNLAQVHDEPFILGWTGKEVAVGPLSEESRFRNVASCVITKTGDAWSMLDRLPVGDPHYMDRQEPLTEDAPARYGTRINPVDHIYRGILES